MPEQETSEKEEAMTANMPAAFFDKTINQTMEMWAAAWQWPVVAAKYWNTLLSRVPDDEDEAQKDKPEKKSPGEVDEALEESFPASDPPSYNPGTASPE